MILPRTLAVTSKLIQDIEKILFRTTIVVQCIFFGYYGYSIYTNLSEMTFLVIYSLLLIISTLSFIHYLSSYRNTIKGKTKSVKRTFRIFKYVVNGSMLVINVIEIIRFGGTDVAYVLVGFSTLSLIFQIIVEFIRVFSSQYLELFTIAIDKDTAFLRRIADANLLSFVDAPLQIIANRLNTDEKELSKNEEYVEFLYKGHKENKTMKKRSRSEASKQRQKDEIKEHYNIIKDKVTKGIKKRYDSLTKKDKDDNKKT